MRGRGLGLILAALSLPAFAAVQDTRGRKDKKHYDMVFGMEAPQPDNRGRRAEKDKAALEKAEKKRQRKAERNKKRVEGA